MNDPRWWHDTVGAVETDLAALGLTPLYTRRDGHHARSLPDGLGWCRARYAPEEAWPPGADLCVIVEWHPDVRYRRDHSTGRVPAGAAEHWRERVAATVQALRSRGYAAAVTGPPRGPHLVPREEILCWRTPPGTPVWHPPPGAWDDVPPTRPNYEHGFHRPGETDPVRDVETLLGLRLEDTTLLGPRTRPDPHPDRRPRVVVRRASAVLWPPGAHRCVRVVWTPAPAYRRRDDGTVPEGAADHWDTGIRRVHSALRAAGHQVRTAARPRSPETHEEVGFLAWRDTALNA
ncbi:hypothetical protein RND61_08125 [Streptomyces sp. TRM76323]|uniref:LigA protein n=1 Tax=Streptomyces tamarix TaxID=3078565 RepID=A0ABU3QH58_9ACTN|nr:hypothetical protein [Streptomyces tamarix]MDT9682041.1 hypothetical protein [Streptomyces tamarix]